MIIQADILKWAEEYDGEPFHALFSDPPYHLTSITKRFGKEGSAPAQYGRDGAFQRASRGFMNARWDGLDENGEGIAFRPETWAAIARHLHPGAFGMAFASSRGWHRMAVAIEDAGLIIHPSIFLYSYGSGFPKATRVPDERFSGHRYGLQAMKPAAEPIVVFQRPYQGRPVDCITRTGAGALNIAGGRITLQPGDQKGEFGPHKPEHLGQETTHGVYGGSFSRAAADQSVGRWPANLLLSHTPACRAVGTRRVKGSNAHFKNTTPGVLKSTIGPTGLRREQNGVAGHADADGYEHVAAWECAEGCPVAALDRQSGELKSHGDKPLRRNNTNNGYGGGWRSQIAPGFYSDSGGASRFFHQSDWAYEIEERIATADPVRYCAKASRTEREGGLDPLQIKLIGQMEIEEQETSPIYGNETPEGAAGRGRKPRHGFPETTVDDGRQTPIGNPYQRGETKRRNTHPTIKPLSLCRYLATLLLPPADYAPRRLLVPFCGAGSEAIGAMLAGWEEVVGVELEAPHVAIANARMAFWRALRYRLLDPSASLDIAVKDHAEEQMTLF